MSLASSTTAFRAYVLRHGQTDYNAAGIEQGSSDYSRLTDLGRQQAGDAHGAFFDGDGDKLAREVTSVYTSPLTRVRQTLEMLREADSRNTDGTVLPASDLVLPNLREIDLYDWQGRTYDELKNAHPMSWSAWQAGLPDQMTVRETKGKDESSSVEHYPVSVEHRPLVEMWERADRVWDEILSLERTRSQGGDSGGDTSVERTALIVAHGNLGQALLGTAMGWDATRFNDPKSMFGNCGLCEIDFGDLEERGEEGPRGPARRWRWRWPEPSPEWNHFD